MRRPAPALVLALLASVACSSSNPAPGPINVLFIAVDDLNDWVGCLGGHPQALTPNIDRLASRGVLFTNAHCAAPACNPSRAAVFSGRMPQVTGVWANDRRQTLGQTFPEARLLPTVFQEAGYRVAGTGKLLHSGGRDAFDEFFSVGQRWSPLSPEAVEYTAEELSTKGTGNPTHRTRDSQGREIILPLNRMPSDRRPDQPAGESFDWGPFDVPDTDFGDTQITDWAIERINDTSRKPFFLGVGYYRPHIPLWAPKRFFDRFTLSPGELPPVKVGDLADLSETARNWALEPVTAGSHATVVRHEQWRPAVEAYLASVTYVDHEIGRLLNALDGSAAAENTLIVLWSDHGWQLGEKEHWGKWTGWERSTKVPLIVAPPAMHADGFAVGSSSDQPVGLIDLYPTLAELCGVEAHPDLDGRSLVPLLREPGLVTGRVLATMFGPNNASLRTDRWRYIRYEDGSEELYDHFSDPNEWDNLAGLQQFSDRIQEMRKAVAPYLTEH